MTQAGAPPISCSCSICDARSRRMAFLPHARAQAHDPVIVQTAHGSIETVISAMRAGAQDFVVKPVARAAAISIKNALSIDALAGEMRRVSKRSQAF